MRRTALLAWELGAGFEHIRRLLDIADALERAGWRVVLAVRNLEALANDARARRLPVFQAPMPPNLVANLLHFQAASHAELLAAFSLGHPVHLPAVLRAWDGILEAVRPDIVVADYSPFLTVAAHGRVPVVTVGDGFVTPPAAVERFPPFHDQGTRPVDENAVLEVVNTVLARRGRPPATRLPALLAGCEQVVCTVPELDVYADLRSEPATGPVGRRLSPSPLPDSERIFFYLAADFAPTWDLLDAVADCGIAAHGHIRAAPPERLSDLRARGLIVYERPQPIGDMLAGSSMVIHHGGIGTSEAALGAGRPQLLLPRHLEQALNARSMMGRGLAGVLRSPFNKDLALKAIAGIMALAVPDGRSALLAADLAQRDASLSMSRILDACDRLARKGATAVA